MRSYWNPTRHPFRQGHYTNMHVYLLLVIIRVLFTFQLSVSLNSFDFGTLKSWQLAVLL